jgi:hypothetical protein
VVLLHVDLKLRFGNTMVLYCSTPARWGREELDHAEVEQRRAAAGEVLGRVVVGKVLRLEPTTSCQRDELWLSSSLTWTGWRPREPGAGSYACLPEQELD